MLPLAERFGPVCLAYVSLGSRLASTNVAHAKYGLLAEILCRVAFCAVLSSIYHLALGGHLAHSNVGAATAAHPAFTGINFCNAPPLPIFDFDFA